MFLFSCGAVVAAAVVVSVFVFVLCGAVVAAGVVFVFIYLGSLGRLGSKRHLWAKWPAWAIRAA